jgi:signal transduction histidine kinase
MLQSPRGLVVDRLLAVAVALLGLAELTGAVPGSLFPATTGVSVVFILLSAAPLAVRRRYPMGAFLAVVVVTTVWQYSVYTVDQQPPFEPFVALLITVFGAGALTEGRAAAAALATVGVGLTLSVADIAFGQPVGIAIPPLVMILGVFALGRLTAVYRRRALESALRAVLAEQSAERSKQEAIASERARIARELHDVISHDVSLMVLQASVERRLLGERPEAGSGTDSSIADVLESIESTGRDALTELRHMLGVLRDAGDAPLAPQPGLDRLDELLTNARSAGVDVHLRRDGVRGLPPGLERLDELLANARAAGVDVHLSRDGVTGLPPGLDLAAYRVVQEALTNVVKHVGPTRVSVSLEHRPDALVIEVVDDGPPRPAGLPGGHGLVGMRERVSLYGGTLLAEPHGGGFRVLARLPITSVATA